MKERVDVLLVERGHAPSREKAKSLIMAGIVFADEQKIDKAGEMVSREAKLEVRGKALPFVSRGGLKLQKALEVFPLCLTDKICMDIGASTGGFTDCMLQHGAKRVYAVDVGYGQLAWKLRTDERVVNLERTNMRYLEKEKVPDRIDFASVDVSFISLRLILPAAKPFLTEDAQMVCLVKPQFEAGREKVGKKGVVRDPAVHLEVLLNVTEFTKEAGFSVIGLDYSPIRGPEGNIEYLMYLSHCPCQETDCSEEALKRLVEASHQKPIE